MALPNGFTGNGVSTPVAEQRDSRFVVGVLKSLCSQLDDHQRVVDQLDTLQNYWNKQQRWNKYGQKSKRLRQKILHLQMEHKKQDEERRIQKLMMQHQHELRDKKCRDEQSAEIQKAQKDLTDHQQEWAGVMNDLNAHQATVHAHLSGRIATKNDGEQRQRDESKSVLKQVIYELTLRNQRKEQVATGSQGSVGKKRKSVGGAVATTAGASMPRSADIGGGEDRGAEGADGADGAKKGKGKKRHREAS